MNAVAMLLQTLSKQNRNACIVFVSSSFDCPSSLYFTSEPLLPDKMPARESFVRLFLLFSTSRLQTFLPIGPCGPERETIGGHSITNSKTWDVSSPLDHARDPPKCARAACVTALLLLSNCHFCPRSVSQEVILHCQCRRSAAKSCSGWRTHWTIRC
jgi:hypothetical protein